MPTKDKVSKPKIKVEEVKEEAEELVSDEPKPQIKEEIKTPTETTKTVETPEPLKVSSFSQLDATEEESKLPKEETVEKSSVSETKSILEAEPETPEPAKPSEEPKDLEPEKKPQVSSEEVKEWLSEVRPDTTKEVAKTGGPNTKLIFAIVIALLILGAIVGGVIYYRQGVSQEKQSPQQEQETPTLAPSQAPTEIDLTIYSVSLLNGSGRAGEAVRVQSLLTAAGFSQEKVKTGNADSYDYKSTTVSLKGTVPEAVFEKINTALGDEYDVVKSEEALEETSSYDIIIIVGARKTSS